MASTTASSMARATPLPPIPYPLSAGLGSSSIVEVSNARQNAFGHGSTASSRPARRMDGGFAEIRGQR